MNLKITKTQIRMALAATLLLGACSKNNEKIPERASEDVEFFISASSGTGTYLLAVPDVTKGETSIVGKGLEADSYDSWIFPNSKVGIGLKYQKGDPGLGISITLGPNGNIIRKGPEFQIVSRYTTYGTFQNKALTVVGGAIGAENPNILYSIFNFIDPDNNNAVRTVTKSTTNLTGNGEYQTLSGIVQVGANEFLTALVPSKLGKNAAGQTTTSATAYPDSVWIAAFDANLNVKRIYRDNRLGYASGRFRSQYYSSIAEDGKGNVYVFSPKNDAASTKPAGVIRIKSGEQDFDQSYFWNIGTQSGNLKFQNVYHIDGDWFALAYVKPGTTVPAGPAQPNAIALVNVVTQKFQWLTNGVPDFNSNPTFGNPISEGGKLYMPISETNQKPAIYIIDPSTLSVSKGITVNADQIIAIGKLSK